MPTYKAKSSKKTPKVRNLDECPPTSERKRGLKRSAFERDLAEELAKPLSMGPEQLLIQATMMSELNDHLREIDEWCASLLLSLPNWILEVKPFLPNAEQDPVFPFMEPMRSRVEDLAP